jgi:hypothetical protein
MPLLSHKGATSSDRNMRVLHAIRSGVPSPYRFGSVVKDWLHKLRQLWVLHAVPGSSPGALR